MSAERLIGALLQGALGGRRKRSRGALRYLSGGRGSLINASTQNTPITTVPANGRSSTIHFNTAGTYVVGAMDCKDPQFPGFLARHQVVVTVAVESP